MTAKLRKNKILGSKWLTADCVPEVTAYFSKISSGKPSEGSESGWIRKVTIYLWWPLGQVWLYMYCLWRSNCRVSVGITLTSWMLPHFCVCSKAGPGFPSLYVGAMVFFVCNYLRWEVIVCFVDEVVDHHCLNFKQYFSYIHFQNRFTNNKSYS